MFALRWYKEALAQYKELREATDKQGSGRQAVLFKQVHKALMYLAGNPRHPSLNTHKYSSLLDPLGERREVFEAYAQNDTPGAYRIFWYYGPGPGQITIIAITAHP